MTPGIPEGTEGTRSKRKEKEWNKGREDDGRGTRRESGRGKEWMGWKSGSLAPKGHDIIAVGECDDHVRLREEIMMSR